MLEILVLCIALVALAGRKGRRRRGRIIVPKIFFSLTLGTLAANTVLKEDLTACDQEMWLISSDIIVGMTDHTAGEGPITVGFAHGDYTVGEIEECVEVAGSWVRSDKVTIEQASRKVRIIGQLPGTDVSETLNDGKKIRVKLGFKLQSGESLALWAHNRDSTALTTGTLIRLDGAVYAKPL